MTDLKALAARLASDDGCIHGNCGCRAKTDAILSALTALRAEREGEIQRLTIRLLGAQQDADAKLRGYLAANAELAALRAQVQAFLVARDLDSLDALRAAVAPPEETP
jgi:hypothetical protein